MSRSLRAVTLALVSVGLFGLTACVHPLRITNSPDTPFSKVRRETGRTIGVVSHGSAAESGGYIEAIAEALRSQPGIDEVIYPAGSEDAMDALVRVQLNPVYKGSGMNFFINFPGFLVWAPAWNGYQYQANPRTRVQVTLQDGGEIEAFSWEHNYIFHQADEGRTWTELSWLEVGAIALIGGIVFTSYDPDQTPAFIDSVSENYGTQIASRISDALIAVPAPAPVPEPTPISEPPDSLPENSEE